jgi:hypothetical protein
MLYISYTTKKNAVKEMYKKKLSILVGIFFWSLNTQ